MSTTGAGTYPTLSQCDCKKELGMGAYALNTAVGLVSTAFSALTFGVFSGYLALPGTIQAPGPLPSSASLLSPGQVTLTTLGSGAATLGSAAYTLYNGACLVSKIGKAAKTGLGRALEKGGKWATSYGKDLASEKPTPRTSQPSAAAATNRPSKRFTIPGFRNTYTDAFDAYNQLNEMDSLHVGENGGPKGILNLIRPYADPREVSALEAELRKQGLL